MPVLGDGESGIGIDAHVHVWTRSTDPQPWIDPDTMAPIDRDFTMDDLAAELDAVDVCAAVVVQSSNSIDETRRLLAAAGDRVVGVVGWLDLAGDVGDQLASFPDRHRAKLVGARHLAHTDPDREWLRRADVRSGLAALGRAGLCFDLVLRWQQLPLAEAIAGDLADVRFVLDHLGNPPLGAPELLLWERSLRALATHPNASAKLSGIAAAFGGPDWTSDMCRGAIEIALDAFGPERLMYGSDWPVVELVGGSARWQQAVDAIVADLSPDEQGAIYGATAASVYGVTIR
jgi:L-fucono-1,5-lactonase